MHFDLFCLRPCSNKSSVLPFYIRFFFTHNWINEIFSWCWVCLIRVTLVSYTLTYICNLITTILPTNYSKLFSSLVHSHLQINAPALPWQTTSITRSVTPSFVYDAQSANGQCVVISPDIAIVVATITSHRLPAECVVKWSFATPYEYD